MVEPLRYLKDVPAKHHHHPSKLYFFIFGLGSLTWFILRTGTKPSRLRYPCQQIALANSLPFLGWMSAILSGHFIYKSLKQVRTKTLFFFLLLSVFLSYPGIKQFVSLKNLVGEVRGAPINSRVVWITNPSAAKGWDGKSWDQRADQSVVANMLGQAILSLTGKTTLPNAWSYIFTMHNPGGADYQPGEKIAIKINNNNYCSSTKTSPHCPLNQLLIPLLSQLVNEKGLAETDITIYDVSRGVPDYIQTAVSSVFPGVKFGSANNCSSSVSVLSARLAQDLVDAKYLINMPLLRSHSLAGATLTFKNNLGSTCSPGNFHGLFSPADTSNGLFQLNNNTHIKDKTILIVADGLYGLKNSGPEEDPDSANGIKPYPNSLFLSTDSVAVDSVMIDYLQSVGSTFNNRSATVRNYLQVSATNNLGNYATSCSGTTCSFSYPNIDLARCDKTCSLSIPTPGDANGDGLVNGVDYVVWLNHYKQSGSGGPSIGDFNNSGLVDGVDYVIWLNNYGT
jgi:uncharacterized protein (DUF362 family)